MVLPDIAAASRSKQQLSDVPQHAQFGCWTLPMSLDSCT